MDMEKLVDCRGRRFLLRVETSTDPEDYRKYEDIRNEVWGFPDDHLAGPRNLLCENYLVDGTSLFIGAFREPEAGGFICDEEHLAGFLYGFAGVRDKSLGLRNSANLWFYSQFAGVKKEYRGLSLGVAMKEFQRQVVLEVLGIGSIVCTFDPLTAVNAYRNISRLGMKVEAYKTAVYGGYGGLLNREDVPSDRFFASWDLRGADRPRGESPRPSEAPETVLELEAASVRGRSGRLSFEVPVKHVTSFSRDTVLVPIPADFYLMLRETDVAEPATRRIPVDWRLATRQVFLALLGSGYEVSDFIRAADTGGSPCYVFRKRTVTG
jgi:predicted GNAT superfamily acetyltransferase